MTIEQAKAEGLHLLDFFSGTDYDRATALDRIEIALPTIMREARQNTSTEHRVSNPSALDSLISDVKKAGIDSCKQGHNSNFVAECLSNHIEPKDENHADDDHSREFYDDRSDGESVQSVREPANDKDGLWYHKPQHFQQGWSQTL